MLSNFLEYGVQSLQEYVCMFWLKHERWSESNGQVTTASCLETLVSKQPYDLVTGVYVVAVDSTEGACPSSAVNQTWVKLLHVGDGVRT